MDKIIIKDLVVFANHGVMKEEQVLGQKFIVSAILETDTRNAGKNDVITDTIHYGEVAAQITAFLQKKNYKLLERAAELLAEELLTTLPLLKQVTITIKKPWAPIGLPLDYAALEITRGWHEVWLSLGSNLGEKADYLNRAVTALKAVSQIQVEEISDWMLTKPYGFTEQPEFLNGCLHLKTLLTPEELLAELNRIEEANGRERTIHWGPRTLDLDILLYDEEIIGTKKLVIPHPELEKRQFVLLPMCQIAPWKRHPVSGKTMKQLLEELEKE